MNLDRDVTDYIQKASKEQAEILDLLRQLIHESVPGTTEAIKWGFPVFAKTKDYTYLRFSKKHITFGFYHPEKIDDPDNILEGNGNTLKHIKIKSKQDIDEQLLASWLNTIAT